MRVATLVKTEAPLNVACEANARADADRAGGMHRGAQPEFAGRAQVHPIVPLIDLQRGGQSSGAASIHQKCAPEPGLISHMTWFENLADLAVEAAGKFAQLADA